MCYESNLIDREKTIKSIRRKSSKRIIGMCFVFPFFFLAGFLVLGSIIYVIKANDFAQGIFLILCSIMCATIPFFIGISLKNTVNYKCTLPYSERANEELTLTDTEIKYSFIKVKKNNAAAYSRFKYDKTDYTDENTYRIRIPYSNIRDIKIENGVCIITGRFFLVPPGKENIIDNEEQKENINILLDFGMSNQEIINMLTNKIHAI